MSSNRKRGILRTLLEAGVLVAVGAGLVRVGFYLGTLKADDELRTAKRLTGEISQKIDPATRRNGDLLEELDHVRAAVQEVRDKLGGCDRATKAPLATVAAEWATEACPATLDLLDHASEAHPIGSERGTFSSALQQDIESHAYRVELRREVAKQSTFAGICWRYDNPPDLSAFHAIETVLQTDQTGYYHFKFELPEASKGQANLVQHLAASGEPKPIRIPLSKLSRDIRAKLGRFCIAISADTPPPAPMRANLQVVSARAQ